MSKKNLNEDSLNEENFKIEEAFVELEDGKTGLVHISEICNRFIKHPSEVLTVGDLVKVMVIGVDVAKKRISLSIKQVKN